MKKLVYVGIVIVGAYSFFSYGLEKSETSVSLLAAQGQAISLQTVHVQFHDMLPQVTSSVSLIKSLNGGGSKRSSASSEGDGLTRDTDTERSFDEPSFSTFTSAPPSPEHSPKNSARKNILSQYGAILPSIKKLIARVPDGDERDVNAAEKLTRNVIAQALHFSNGKNIEPISSEQDDIQLKQEIERQNAPSSGCCVIL